VLSVPPVAAAERNAMNAPRGAIVSLSPFDWDDDTEPVPEPGDCIVSNGGSAYRIVEIQVTRRPGRYRVTCLKLGREADVPPGSRVVRMRWYARKRHDKPCSGMP
jgi:hypothetical protein